MVATTTISELKLDGGSVLADVPVAYRTWGALNRTRDNAVVVCHALTGDTNVDSWWGPLLGPGRVLDTDRYFVICANVLGSPYGTASPLTSDPSTGRPYGADFPVVTIRDTVRLHRLLLEQLDVRGVAMAIGGSMGGMQVLEWGLLGGFVRALVPIAVGGRHSAWCVAWSEAQRQAIYADPHWQGGRYDPDAPPRGGLAAARMMAMVSYRSQASFAERFGRERMEAEAGAPFAIESYLRYQGEKLVNRFDANCYVRLTQQMDAHDVSAGGKAPYQDVLGAIRQPTLVLGIDTDVLYPLAEQQELATYLPHARLEIVESVHGHDSFLIEFEQLDALIQPWMQLNIERHAPAAAGACL